MTAAVRAMIHAPVKLDIDTLRRAPAFAALSTEASQALALCFRGRRYAAGQVVFREGDPAASLFFLAQGELEANTHVGGAPSKLGRIGPGQLVGESALIDPTPRTATVTAARASVVYEIGEESVEILRRNAPTAARALTSAAIVGVVRHLRHLQQRLERELDRVGAMP